MDEKARELIASHLGVSAHLIRDDTAFRDLGADSLDLISLTMAFEESFDLPISDEEAESCQCVGDAIALLERRLSEHGCGAGSDRPKAAELSDGG